MWQYTQSAALREETDALLEPLCEVEGLHTLVRRVVEKDDRKTGSPSAMPPWPLLPLIVCEGISGHFESAVPLAVAIGLFKSAAEVFDDIEDADSSQSLAAMSGPAVATNVGTTLLLLAEREIARLQERGVPDATIVRLLEVLNAYYVKACAGQHLDLDPGPGLPTEEEYLRMVTLKSASHVECACAAGAIAAGGDEPTVLSYAGFGCNLGVAAQIANDIQGIDSGTDIGKRKITLPAIFALANANEEDANSLADWYRNGVLQPGVAKIEDILTKSGAVYYALLKGELFKQKALESLGGARPDEATLSRLKMFIGPTRGTHGPS